MKLKTMMLAALAALTLASCSKDNDGGKNNLPSGDKSYVTVTLTQSKANTRAATYSNLEPTAEESKINTANLYIFDAETDLLEFVVAFSDLANSQSQTALITMGAKKYVAVANMSLANVTVGTTTLEDLQYKVLNAQNTMATLATDNSFWMTSTGVVPHFVVAATEAEAKQPNHNNNVTLPLGRAMAKVGVYFDADDVKLGSSSLNPGGELVSAEYRVRQNPNEMYLLGEKGSTGILRTPYFENNVTTDGDYFDTAGGYHATGLDGAGYHASPSYMMENSNLVARYGNATYLCIKAVFKPAAYSEGGTVTAGETFYRVRNSDGTYEAPFYKNSPAGLTQGQTVVEYPNGVCYYHLYLKDDEQGADKYTVRRNTYWDVVIKSISGCGYNDEDGGTDKPGPEIPLETEAYINATIKVVDWERVTMGGDLEGVK